MKPLQQILDGIELAVEEYELCKIGDATTQSGIAKNLGVNLFFLVEHKVEAHSNWTKAFTESKQKSDQKREAEANTQNPEYYKICQIQKAGENLLNVVRSTISANKSN